jgi:probable phosphoglycerate mutase
MREPERAFFFLRHAETDYNRERRFQGRVDVPLNEVGFAQARDARNVLDALEITRIVSSPARRVRQTIHQFAADRDLDVVIDEDLMEFYVGSFEGRLHADVRRELALASDESLYSLLPPDADDWDDFAARVVRAVGKWLHRLAGDTVLFASHGLVFQALCLALAGKEAVSGNAQVHHFRPAGDYWEVTIAQPDSAIW